MSTDLIIVHIVFIVACVYFAYRSGLNNGGNDVVEALLDRGLLSHEDLEKEFGDAD